MRVVSPSAGRRATACCLYDCFWAVEGGEGHIHIKTIMQVIISRKSQLIDISYEFRSIQLHILLAAESVFMWTISRRSILVCLSFHSHSETLSLALSPTNRCFKSCDARTAPTCGFISILLRSTTHGSVVESQLYRLF